MDQFLSPAVICERIPSLTESLLAQLRYAGRGPRFYKPTQKTVLYKESEVIEWIESTAEIQTGRPIDRALAAA